MDFIINAQTTAFFAKSMLTPSLLVKLSLMCADTKTKDFYACAVFRYNRQEPNYIRRCNKKCRFPFEKEIKNVSLNIHTDFIYDLVLHLMKYLI